MISEQLRRVVESLPPVQQACIVLYQRGEACAEIAKALTADITAVRESVIYGMRTITAVHNALQEAFGNHST
jgi:DNA-directed RNA polymerase specialized sigma24 family protein